MKKKLAIDWEDEIINSVVLTHNGKVKLRKIYIVWKILQIIVLKFLL